MTEIVELADLDIASNYRMSDLDNIDWEELEASVIPSTHVVSTQKQALEVVETHIQTAYNLSCKAQKLERTISKIQQMAWKLRSLSRAQMLEVQKLLKY